MSSNKLLRGISSMPAMSHRTGQSESRAILSRNLRFLMDQHGMVERDFETKAKVAQKTVNLILNKNSAATIDTMERIASMFRLEVWQLIDPRLPDLYPSLKQKLPGDIVRKVRGEN